MFENKMNAIGKAALAILASALLALAAACGGGGGVTGIGGDDEIGLDRVPAPGTANFSGMLVQSGAGRVLSQAGQGLPGVWVTLIDTLTGGTLGIDITGATGEFEFEGVPAGENYLVKIEFTSGEDLDGDGEPDEIEIYFPVSLADQAIVELLQEIGVADSDGDGQLDALEVEIEISDDRGNHSQDRHQHRRRHGETRQDSDGDGSFDDETPENDSDADGLPDASSSDSSGSDDGAGIHELEVKGAIEMIDGVSITVGGVTFTLTGGSQWRIGDDRNADPARFGVGTFVEVEGMPDGNGGWFATKVKTEDDNESEDDDSGDEGEGSGNGGNESEDEDESGDDGEDGGGDGDDGDEDESEDEDEGDEESDEDDGEDEDEDDDEQEEEDF